MPAPRLLPAALALALLPGAALATPEGWSPLLEPAQLAALLDEHGEDIRVIHVSDAAGPAVIEGATYSPYSAWRGPLDNPGALRSTAQYEAVIRELGIEDGMPVVVVHPGLTPNDFGSAARVYWTLRSLGVEDLALLNGGFAAWEAEGLPVSAVPESFFPSDFTATWQDTWTVGTDEVAALAGTGDAQLLDARPREFFEGLEWSVAPPGTIRGAGHLAYTDLMDGTRLLGAERIRDLAAQAGLQDGAATVSFCNGGQWAAINWFALSELAGLEGVRLYPESMAGYGAAQLPLDNAPGRAAIHWRATTRWVAELF